MASCIYHDDFGAGRAMGQEVAVKALKRNGGRPEDCKILVLLVKIRQQVLPEKTGSAKDFRKQGLLSMTIGTDANQNLQ